jgi:hypothetical protein
MSHQIQPQKFRIKQMERFEPFSETWETENWGVIFFGQKRNTFQALGSLQNSNSRQFEENLQQSPLPIYTVNPYMHQSSWRFHIVVLCKTQTLKANASVQ